MCKNLNASSEQDVSTFKIGINDKLEKILQMLDLEGYLVYNHKMVLKEKLE